MRVCVSALMAAIAILCTVVAASDSVVKYQLPPRDGGTTVHTDVLWPALAAAVVCGVAAVLLLGWLVWNVRTAPPRAHWIAPAVLLVITGFALVLGISVENPTY